MPSFRFKAVNNAGKLIQGEFEAENKKAAKALLEKQGRQRGFKVQGLEQRSVFKYKVEKDGKPLQGEQEAYSKEELQRALTKLGYKIQRIDRNVIEFKSGVPMTEVVNFIRLSSDLLRQKMNFDEILNLLYEDTANKGMKDVIKTIQKDLKDGKEGTEVYAKHEKVFGKFACYMLGVASTSGNMGLVFESTA
jgi:type IV pilus assembly protein PilC